MYKPEADYNIPADALTELEELEMRKRLHQKAIERFQRQIIEIDKRIAELKENKPLL